MFVLLGPFHGEMDYHEVGRSISTLMSDKGFHEVAYRAHSRGQLLSAINEFLNASIVLPPSDWNNKDLVPIDDIRAKANQIMKKKESLRSKRKQTETGKAPPRASFLGASRGWLSSCGGLGVQAWLRLACICLTPPLRNNYKRTDSVSIYFHIPYHLRVTQLHFSLCGNFALPPPRPHPGRAH